MQGKERCIGLPSFMASGLKVTTSIPSAYMIVYFTSDRVKVNSLCRTSLFSKQGNTTNDFQEPVTYTDHV